MIYGIGTDVVVIARLGAALEQFGDKFATKILSANELPLFQKCSDKPRFLAKRFAAKEAFAKALGTGVRGFWFTDIEVSHNALGKPSITALGRCKAICDVAKIAGMHLSVSDEKDLAQAFVVLEVSD